MYSLQNFSIVFQRVDCANRQCNLTKETSNKESCQKCHDLENCYNYVVILRLQSTLTLPVVLRGG